MINVVSLAVVAGRALPGKIKATSIGKVCEQMKLDPTITGIDGVILSTADVKGANRDKINKALKFKHPGVVVIYLYTKDTEASLIDTECKFKVKKIKESTVNEAVAKFIGDNIIKTGKTYTSSRDFITPGAEIEADAGSKAAAAINYAHSDTGPEEEEIHYVDGDNDAFSEMTSSAPEEMEEIEEIEEPAEEVEEIEEVADLDIPMQDMSKYTDMQPQPLGNDASANATVTAATKQSGKIEDTLRNLNNFSDWEIFKQNLKKDSITQHLIEENTEYAGIMNYLDVLDEQIKTVWRDNTLSGSEKFEKIKKIGLDRSALKAQANSINVDKAISIITTVTMAAARTVDEKVNSIDLALYKITTDKQAITDTSKIDEMIRKRTEVQFELLEIGRKVVDLYKSMRLLVTDEIKELDEKLPSNSVFVNDQVKTVGVNIFTPVNSAELANKLFIALEENRITASQMESKVHDIIESLFKLCETDEEIIRYQQNMINMLKANRVEDVVIADSLLKKCLSLYIGPTDSGVHATAITWSGVLSRRHNTLLIDITGHSKFKDYGIAPVDISDFKTERIEKNFLCVESTQKMTLEELQEFVVELKSRLNYYNYINIIVDQDDKETLEQLSADALVVHYITSCTSKNLDKMHEINAYPVVKNIARKLVLIDVPMNPIMLAEQIDIDVTLTKLIEIPNIPQIRACEISHDRPYDFEDIRAIFEEAFR